MKIGLTYTGSDTKHGYYRQWLEGNEKDIQVVKLSEKENNLDDFADCDGLLLSGGVDMNSKFYGGEDKYPGRPEVWQEERDVFEMKLLKTAIDKQIPVFGMCRGLQLINVALGGTLIQDLGAGNNAVHTGSPDKKHPIHVEKDTMLYAITGATEGVVNSAHHQAIDKLGDGLKINCRSDQGTIEGIEWADSARKPFLLGVQWHAERMFKFTLGDSPFASAVRNKFIESIREQLSSK